MHPPYFTIIEMEGHLIDSLTLAKVIDKIQHAGVDYQINDLHIGLHKHDVSTAQISIWAHDRNELGTLLNDLRSYGAIPVPDSEVALRPCPRDGVAPEGANIRQNPPMEVLHDGAWVAVARQGYDLAIVVDGASARIERTGNLKQGDQVVCGVGGIKFLPTEEGA